MRNVRRDLYQILEVDPRARVDQIKLAYRRMARRYHPDINPSPNAKARMQAINQAYEVLGNPIKRAQYDQWRTLMQGSWATYASSQSPRTARPQRSPPGWEQRQGAHSHRTWQQPPPYCNAQRQRSPPPRSWRRRSSFWQPKRSRTGFPNWVLWLLIPALCNGFSRSVSNSMGYISSQPVERNPTNARAAFVAASGWPLIMFDEFDSSNPNQWNTRYTSSRVTITKVIDGKYVWNVEAHRDVTVWTHAPFRDRGTTNEFVVSVDCRRVSGSKTSAMGLVFRSSDENLYYFRVGNEGRFGVFLLEGGEWTTLIPSTLSDAIQPGDVNRLTVVGQGAHFLFLINNQYVGEVEDPRLTHGSVGIAINLRHSDEEAIFEFDNFELRQPEADPASQHQPIVFPTPTIAPDPGVPSTTYNAVPIPIFTVVGFFLVR